MRVKREQVLGAWFLFLLSAALWLLTSREPPQTEPLKLDIPYSRESRSTVAVEVAGESEARGVYYVPRGTPVNELVRVAGIPAPDEGAKAPRRLTLATTIEIDGHGASVGPMPAKRRLSLGLPVNLNRSGLDELSLVPGVGEITAGRILEFRKGHGPFRNLEELMLVKGIKEKRFEKLKPHFCTSC